MDRNDTERSTKVRSIRNPFRKIEEMRLGNLAPPSHILESNSWFILHELRLKDNFIITNIIKSFLKSARNIKNVYRNIDGHFCSY